MVIDFSFWPKSSTTLTIPLAPATLVVLPTAPFFLSVSVELPVTVDGVETETFSDLVASGDFYSFSSFNLAAFSAAAASLFFYLSTSGSSRERESL